MYPHAPAACRMGILFALARIYSPISSIFFGIFSLFVNVFSFARYFLVGRADFSFAGYFIFAVGRVGDLGRRVNSPPFLVYVRVSSLPLPMLLCLARPRSFPELFVVQFPHTLFSQS